MSYDFSTFKQRIGEIHEWLKKEFQTIRTGQATPAILDGVRVSAYDTTLPISQLAHVTIENAQSLRVVPWDTTQTKAIEKAITESDIGVSVQADENGVRVIFPELTGERRVQLKKILKQKKEDAVTSIRKAREEVWDDIRSQKKEGTISEDDMYRYKDEMEDIVQSAQDDIKSMEEKKEKEIES